MSVSHPPSRQTSPMNIIGRAQRRVDGALKVTGKAQYATDHHLSGMLYAVPMGATIARGRITGVDAAIAEQMPGVRAVLRRGSFPPLASVGSEMPMVIDEHRPPFADNEVRYYGQYVALAVADSLEQAKAAADAVRVSYTAEIPRLGTHTTP